jgi:predicted Zn-dependent protease with MMP-like domain
MTRAEFEALVDRALRRLPRHFRDKLANVAVLVEDWADEPPSTRWASSRPTRSTALPGHRHHPARLGYGNVLPDTIHIYQGPIEEDCADPKEMADLVRDVVIHEIGHYFGLDDETMEGIESGG